MKKRIIYMKDYLYNKKLEKMNTIILSDSQELIKLVNLLENNGFSISDKEYLLGLSELNFKRENIFTISISGERPEITMGCFSEVAAIPLSSLDYRVFKNTEEFIKLNVTKKDYLRYKPIQYNKIELPSEKSKEVIAVKDRMTLERRIYNVFNLVDPLGVLDDAGFTNDEYREVVNILMANLTDDSSSIQIEYLIHHIEDTIFELELEEDDLSFMINAIIHGVGESIDSNRFKKIFTSDVISRIIPFIDIDDIYSNQEYYYKLEEASLLVFDKYNMSEFEMYLNEIMLKIFAEKINNNTVNLITKDIKQFML